MEHKPKSVTIRLHREILGMARSPGASTQTHGDHLNHDTLDNRRSNLQVKNLSDSHRNRRLRTNSVTGYKGVTYHKAKLKYAAVIHVNQKKIHIGYFKTALEAAHEVNKQQLLRLPNDPPPNPNLPPIPTQAPTP